MAIGQVAVPSGRMKPRPERLTLCWHPARKRYADKISRIQALMASIDGRLPLRDGRALFASKVSFEESRTAPVHRWYFYKEGYSPNLLTALLAEVAPPKGGLLLDPFAGVGTTLVSATQLQHQPFTGAVGVEYNPFAGFVARTKLTWPRLDSWRISTLGQAILAASADARELPPIPPSTTLRDERIFPRARLCQLRELSSTIDSLSSGLHRDALRLALASILEPASYAEKDGRALRILSKDTRRPGVRPLFANALATMSDDLHRVGKRQKGASEFPVTIHSGDARSLPKTIADASVSLAMYSPPYLNGIDYTEVYKVEEWFLGFIGTKQSMFDLRQGTLRSHASVRFKQETSEMEDELDGRSTVLRLMREITEFFETEEPRHFQKQYAWLIPAYFEDMYRVLKEQYRVLMPGGYSVCVVANSMFTGSLTEVQGDGDEVRRELWRLPLATDAIIAELGLAVGFDVLPAIGARDLRPRNVTKGWSRETILLMRKPGGRR